MYWVGYLTIKPGSCLTTPPMLFECLLFLLSFLYCLNKQFHILSLSFIFSDAPEAWQMGVQDPATPVAEEILKFHNYLIIFILIIGMFVIWLLYQIIKNFSKKISLNSENFTHSSGLEIVWTILPAIALLFIAIPSFTLLYSLDDLIEPSLTLKIIGHQWYWSYEYSDLVFNNQKNSLTFDSYMVPTSDLVLGSFRLLEVDNRVVLPINSHIRLLITASDVLHSWSVSSLGIKLDATPGRMSQTSVYIGRNGVFTGQCSELCGINHGFMPIIVRSLDSNSFIEWVHSKVQLEPSETCNRELDILKHVLKWNKKFYAANPLGGLKNPNLLSDKILKDIFSSLNSRGLFKAPHDVIKNSEAQVVVPMEKKEVAPHDVIKNSEAQVVVPMEKKEVAPLDVIENSAAQLVAPTEEKEVAPLDVIEKNEPESRTGEKEVYPCSTMCEKTIKEACKKNSKSPICELFRPYCEEAKNAFLKRKK